MEARELPARPNLDQYRKQAKELLRRWKADDPKTTCKLADAQSAIAREHGFATWKAFTDRIAAVNGGEQKAALFKAAADAVVAGDASALERLLRTHEPMFRNQRPPATWSVGLAPNQSPADARTIVAREHFFDTWVEFVAFKQQLSDASSPVAPFERAVDAIVSGDANTLMDLLKKSPDLIRARSTRTHHSTLLHYAGANGVEGWRQRTPANAVQIAEILLDAGSDIEAVADMYNGGCTTLGLVATSIHPRVAGVLQPLIDLLLARGARIDTPGGGNSSRILNSCLANGRPEAADYLARRGAPLDLEGAAGVGRLDLVKSFFDSDGGLTNAATRVQLEDGFTWACEYGRTDVVEFLLNHGVSADEVLPRPHKQTGVHWAAYGGHLETVRALLKRQPRLDIRDASFNGTPLGWALYGWWERRAEEFVAREPYYEIVALLVAAGAPVEPVWLTKDETSADARMIAALTRQRADS
jgi:ankyrin repeat protein